MSGHRVTRRALAGNLALLGGSVLFGLGTLWRRSSAAHVGAFAAQSMALAATAAITAHFTRDGQLYAVAGMLLLLIFLGIFVDQVSMMLITLPVFMPIVQRLGIDLVWFGVLYLICMQLGLLLPPHGLLLMTMKGVAPPQVTMGDIFRAVAPFVAMSILVLALVFLLPAVAVWLPNFVG